MSTKIQAKANLIWEVATKLVGVYKPNEYGKVILPMTVLKRFDDILKPTKEALMKRAMPVSAEAVKIVPAQLGNNAGVIGASLLIES